MLLFVKSHLGYGIAASECARGGPAILSSMGDRHGALQA
jgi:hypothetical protein